MKHIQIQPFEIEKYEKVYNLWMSCKNMGFNNVDDSLSGITKYPDKKITVIDSRSTGPEMALIVVKLCQPEGFAAFMLKRVAYLLHFSMRIFPFYLIKKNNRTEASDGSRSKRRGFI